jgi:nucleoside-diphosphate-sugar epimerase
LTVTGSASKVIYLPSRQVEVTRFVADVSRMRKILGIDPPDDPLAGIASLLNAEKIGS